MFLLLLVRLVFKEGNLHIPVSYTYFKTKNDEIRLRTQST